MTTRESADKATGNSDVQYTMHNQQLVTLQLAVQLNTDSETTVSRRSNW